MPPLVKLPTTSASPPEVRGGHRDDLVLEPERAREDGRVERVLGQVHRVGLLDDGLGLGAGVVDVGPDVRPSRHGMSSAR